MLTVHAPQLPSLQPSLEPVMPTTSPQTLQETLARLAEKIRLVAVDVWSLRGQVRAYYSSPRARRMAMFRVRRVKHGHQVMPLANGAAHVGDGRGGFACQPARFFQWLRRKRLFQPGCHPRPSPGWASVQRTPAQCAPTGWSGRRRPALPRRRHPPRRCPSRCEG